jgi:HSP20 family protein
MTLSRWNPWSDIETLNAQFDNLMGALRRGERGASAAFVPAVDIIEHKEGFLVKLDLPGVKLEEVEIEVENRTLVVRGERRLEETAEGEAYRRVERAFGHFSRAFTLPNNAHTEQISAKAREGVLTITIPKKPDAQPRRIAIEA